MKSNKCISLSPGYHAEPGPTPGHQHDIYTTTSPLEGNRRHVGTLSKAAVEAWASSPTEMATALLFALEHDDDKDVADFLRDWMRGDTSRWFEFTPKYRAALAEKAIALATSPMVSGACICGADPGKLCRHPNQACTSLNHPVIRARIDAEYGS